MRTLIEVLLIVIAGYCFMMWFFGAATALLLGRRGALSDPKARDIADFTYRVGLVGTIALAALYIGG